MATATVNGTEYVNNFDYNKLKDRGYKGEDYHVDISISKGPLQDRKCTDCLFFLIFIAFLGGMGYMTIDGYVNGQVDIMLAPISQNQIICGFNTIYGDATDYPVLYTPDISAALSDFSNYFSYGVCAESCPKSSDSTVTCIAKDSEQGQCNSTPYATSNVMNYCFPTTSTIKEYYTGTGYTVSNYYVDMYESRWVILTCIGFALCFALIYLKMMDWFAVQMAWITIILIEGALAALGYFAYNYSHQILTTHAGVSTTSSTGLMWMAGILWAFAGLYYICMLINFKSLRISIAVIETAADFFTDTKRIVFVPLIYFCIWCGIFIAWIYAITGVASITDQPITVDSIQFQSKNVMRSSGTNWMIAGMTLGFVWITAFIIACNEFAVICASATWYFSRKDIADSDGIPGDADVWKGFWWTFRYQMGTLAFGSFLLTLVWAIRALFEYIGEKLHQASAGNKCTECLLCCCRCCLDCFDRFVRYLNRNAYIYCAISSESFCPSALHSFLLILKNSAKFAFVEGIADGFMFLAKSFIAVCTTLCGYGLLQSGMVKFNVDPTLPCIFIFFFAYLVAAKFISIFDVSANTILQCYLYDKDMAEHHGLDLKHVPPTLLKFLELHSQNVQVNASSDLKQNMMA